MEQKYKGFKLYLQRSRGYLDDCYIFTDDEDFMEFGKKSFAVPFFFEQLKKCELDGNYIVNIKPRNCTLFSLKMKDIEDELKKFDIICK